MTTPDSRPIQDVIAFTVSQHRLVSVSGGTATGSTWVCGCGDSERSPGTREWAAAQHSRHVAAAVVAACQQATVAQQAELTNGEIEHGWDSYTVSEAGPVARVVGPWRKRQP